MSQEDRKYYIDVRIYLRHDANQDEVAEVADLMQDKIADIVSDEGAPHIFTQDVTYEIVREWTPKIN